MVYRDSRQCPPLDLLEKFKRVNQFTQTDTPLIKCADGQSSYSNMPTADQSNMPTADQSNMQTADQSNMPTADQSNMPTADQSNMQTADQSNM